MSSAGTANVAALRAAAARAMGTGAVASARDLLEQAVRIDGSDLGLWMDLAACRRGMQDLAGALEAVQAALAIEPRAYMALLMKATLLERTGAPHQAGEAYGIALTQVPPVDRLPPQARAATEHAREVHARYQAAMAGALLDGVGPMKARASGPDARRMQAFVDQLSGRRKVYHQAPVQFHYPNLPEIEFLDREDTPWLADFEARTPDIIEELAGVLREDAGQLEPYVDYPPGTPLDQWAELNRSPRWSGYHLLLNGERVEEHCRRCPRTLDAIAMLPQPRVAGRSPAAMFSVLQPRTRIPPHHGISNTRLVLHLPLVVPPDCGFRVGNETRQWKVGEAWVFDDTIEHEAWNNSDQVRTILICDLWNPRLSEDERAMIAQVMAAMDDFAGVRPGGDGL